MKAEISFDCIYEGDEEDLIHVEGCYRLPGQDWQIFYVTNHWWDGDEGTFFGRWPSGQTGVEIRHPKNTPLTVPVVKEVLGHALGVLRWVEVHGPDSLQMK